MPFVPEWGLTGGAVAQLVLCDWVIQSSPGFDSQQEPPTVGNLKSGRWSYCVTQKTIHCINRGGQSLEEPLYLAKGGPTKCLGLRYSIKEVTYLLKGEVQYFRVTLSPSLLEAWGGARHTSQG